MGEVFSQIMPPAPVFTEKDLGSQSGKVFLITGAASGVGWELAKILYQKGGAVYVAARSLNRATQGIKSLQEACPSATGRLEPLVVDLADLETIRPAVEHFLSHESRLDVLVHNAGVMRPPGGSRSKQGHDLEMGTNCLGPLLLQHLLEDSMVQTAALKMTKPDTVRIVWVSSGIHMMSAGEGLQFDANGTPRVLKDAMANYMQSKVGDVFNAAETAKYLGAKGVVVVSIHPGLIKTELQRHLPAPVRFIMSVLFKPAKYGAYTELFAGWSPQIQADYNGGFIIPWGRKSGLPKDINKCMKTQAEGGTGVSAKFYAWCEQEIKSFK